ncbi:MAG TPA: hypothetical protein DCM45_06605 [Clostridiales bacterium]|nr:hypothetical protein [Clostridiales bacterium]
MQIVDLPAGWTVVLIVILWPSLQMLAGGLSRRLPDRLFNHQSSFYRSQPWEKDGKIYQTWFKIRCWKPLLPDGGAIIPGGYSKKHLTDYSSANLDKFLHESCRAEFSHWIAIMPFWLFGLIGPPVIIVFMLIYALAVNTPCIMAQRFNRPRIVKVKGER